MPAPVVASVSKDSIAHTLGIEPGHRVLAMNDQPLRDILDYRFHSSSDEVKLHVVDGEGRESLFIVEKDAGEPLGMEFNEVIFDQIAVCSNHCSFCFIDALPSGMRPSLYLKDDDYRLSFLYGNFVTLTNLTKEDWQRIHQMRISPLYVSVHTTDHPLRQRMLGSDSEESIIAQLQRLAAWGITVHVQIVLVPGVNDGVVLDNTLEQLSPFYPHVQSVGVVPVGTTRHRQRPVVQAKTHDAQSVLRQLARWQETARARWGQRWVYPGDEWYPLSGFSYPPCRTYDDFPQLENGVGMASLFREELKTTLLREIAQTNRDYVIVTGMLAAPLLQEAARALTTSAGQVRVLPVANRMFGSMVTTAGLLGGEDVLAALKSCQEGETAVLPNVMLNEETFLDDMTLRELRTESPIPVEVIPARAEALVKRIGAGGNRK